MIQSIDYSGWVPKIFLDFSTVIRKRKNCECELSGGKSIYINFKTLPYLIKYLTCLLSVVENK